MLERAREVTRNGKYTYIEYARFADDLVILIDAYKRHDWLVGALLLSNHPICFFLLVPSRIHDSPRKSGILQEYRGFAHCP